MKLQTIATVVATLVLSSMSFANDHEPKAGEADAKPQVEATAADATHAAAPAAKAKKEKKKKAAATETTKTEEAPAAH